MLTCKAAEARGMLEFVVHLLEMTLPDLDPLLPVYETAQMLLACASAAVDVDHLLRSTGRADYSDASRAKLFRTYMHHLQLYDRCGGNLLPKHHMMVHMIHKTSRLGHPSLYATFRDESLNGVVAKIAKSCHRRSFNHMVHLKFQRLRALAGSYAMQMHG